MRLIPLLMLTLTACTLPDDHTHNREGTSAGSSNAGRGDAGFGREVADRFRDAGYTQSRHDSGFGAASDTGPWWLRDDAGSPEDQDVFIGNPVGTYAVIEPFRWDDEMGVRGVVFADNHGLVLLTNLENCTTRYGVYAEWNIDEMGRLMLTHAEEEEPSLHLRGAVLDGGDVRLAFPAESWPPVARYGEESVLLRAVESDCHVTESHLGTWRAPPPGDGPDIPSGLVFTETQYHSMPSLDPCFPMMSRSYELRGPWLRVADPEEEEWSQRVGIYIKRGWLMMGDSFVDHYIDLRRYGFDTHVPGFQRDARCEDGQVSRPPAQLVGTYEVVEGRGPAELFALSADGTLSVLASASPCRVTATGQYTADDHFLWFRVSIGGGVSGRYYRYTMEGSRIRIFEEEDVDFTVERLRSACH